MRRKSVGTQTDGHRPTLTILIVDPNPTDSLYKVSRYAFYRGTSRCARSRCAIVTLGCCVMLKKGMV